MPLKEALCSDMNYFMQITRFRVKIPPPGIALFLFIFIIKVKYYFFALARYLVSKDKYRVIYEMDIDITLNY